MRRCRIFCLPSHGEGMPNCVMEALCCGLPIVATRVGGIPEIVQDGTSGVLVEKQDVDALAFGLNRLLSDFAECASMGRAGYLFAREHLDAKKNAGRMIDLYHELIRSYSMAKPCRGGT